MSEKPGFDYITEEHADRLANSNVRPGDIVFTHRGTIGQVSLVPRNARHRRYVVSQSQMYVRCDESKILPEFTAYWFASRQGQHALLANSSQVGVPSIAQPVSYLKTIEITIPPMADQRAIAGVLGTLDDRIELNQRMNETLEAMARALFKSWFIDFDPVRAKMEGRDTGLPQDIADLFPDRLVASEGGPTPETWTDGCLEDIADVKRRGAAADRLAPGTPYIGLQHMPRRSIALADWGDSESLASGKFRFSRGEVLFGKLRPYFHKAGIAPVDGVCSTDIVVMAPKEARWLAFVLSLVSSAEFVTWADLTSTGTRMPRTNWKSMSAYRLSLPSPAVVEAYERTVGPFLKRVLFNIHESRRLAAQRDALLGVLISGSVRVGEFNASEPARVCSGDSARSLRAG